MGRGSGDRLYRLRLPPMDVPHGYDPTLILVLNLAGTFVFGLSGGLAAVRAKLDLFGVVVLAAGGGPGRGIPQGGLVRPPPAALPGRGPPGGAPGGRGGWFFARPAPGG